MKRPNKTVSEIPYRIDYNDVTQKTLNPMTRDYQKRLEYGT